MIFFVAIFYLTFIEDVKSYFNDYGYLGCVIEFDKHTCDYVSQLIINDYVLNLNKNEKKCFKKMKILKKIIEAKGIDSCRRKFGQSCCNLVVSLDDYIYFHFGVETSDIQVFGLSFEGN
jgi:hypothetical protein